MAKTASQKVMASASYAATAAEGLSATPPISATAAYAASATSKEPAGYGGSRPSGTHAGGKEAQTGRGSAATAYAAPLPAIDAPAEVCQTAAKPT